MTNPTPPDGCTCASFWTVRQTHKKDCPLSDYVFKVPTEAYYEFTLQRDGKIYTQTVFGKEIEHAQTQLKAKEWKQLLPEPNLNESEK